MTLSVNFTKIIYHDKQKMQHKFPYIKILKKQIKYILNYRNTGTH